MDEPPSALDPISTAKIEELIDRAYSGHDFHAFGMNRTRNSLNRSPRS